MVMAKKQLDKKKKNKGEKEGLIKEINSQTATEAELVFDKKKNVAKEYQVEQDTLEAINFIDRFAFNYINLKRILHERI